MPEPIERKRLKKKMLDRWENEGGSIVPDSAGADDISPASEHARHGKQPFSRGKQTAAGPAAPAKRRKATPK